MSDYIGPDALSVEDQLKWSDFVDLLNSALETVFGDDPSIAAVIGVQFGDMGSDDHPELPVCITSSNLSVCQTVGAVEEMLSTACAAHEEVHRRSANQIREQIPEANVPAEVVAQARAYLEEIGLPPDTELQFIEVADAEDLAETVDASAFEDHED